MQHRNNFRKLWCWTAPKSLCHDRGAWRQPTVDASRTWHICGGTSAAMKPTKQATRGTEIPCLSRYIYRFSLLYLVADTFSKTWQSHAVCVCVKWNRLSVKVPVLSLTIFALLMTSFMLSFDMPCHRNNMHSALTILHCSIFWPHKPKDWDCLSGSWQ